MINEISYEQAKQHFDDLQLIIGEKLNRESIISKINHYEDDGCWSADLAVSGFPVLGSNELEDLVEECSEVYNFIGGCSDYDPHKPKNKYSVHLVIFED